jgi:hypothetical protein
MEYSRSTKPAFPSLYTLTDALTGHGEDEMANFHLYGQAAALNVELPAAALVERLVKDTRAAFRRLR